MSRMFERDRDTVIARARNSQVGGMLCWFADVEKQQLLADLCRTHEGFAYFAPGIHPENVDRVNKKLNDGWLERVGQLATRPECIAVSSGVNMGRDSGSHFAQESLLRSCYGIARRLKLPLVLHAAADGASLDRIIEVLTDEAGGEGHDEDDEEGAAGAPCPPIVLHDALAACAGSEERMRSFLHSTGHRCYCILSAATPTPASSDSGSTAGTDTDTDADSARHRTAALLRLIPRDRLLLGSDSPWHTPQNIPDEYIRTSKNEPSNLLHVVESVWDAMQGDAAGVGGGPPCATVGELQQLLLDNTWELFGLAAASVPIAEATATTTAPKARRRDRSESSVGKTDDTTGAVPNNTVAAAASKVGDADGENSNYYSCKRCRCPLFSETQLSRHDSGAANRTVFRVGEKSLCSAVCFIPYYSCAAAAAAASTAASASSSSSSSSKGGGGGGKAGKRNRRRGGSDISAGSDGGHADANTEEAADEIVAAVLHFGLQYPNLTVAVGSNNAVRCTRCDTKFGQYFESETTCPCGAAVHGPVIKITSAKVDHVEAHLTAEQLAARAVHEADLAMQQSMFLSDAPPDQDTTAQKKPKKKKGKMKHERGAGNFSQFRNKSFIPNASRVAAAAEVLRKGGKKGKNRGLEIPVGESSGEEEEEESRGSGSDSGGGSHGEDSDEEDEDEERNE